MKFTINMNDTVKVKLTDEGRAIHKETWCKDMAGYRNWTYQEPKTDYEGYSRFQLWELMQMFGSSIHNGCKIPFETEILLHEAM